MKMYPVLFSTLVLLGLSGCASETIFGETEKIVVIAPNPAVYLQCPDYVDLPPASDQQQTSVGMKILWNAYSGCQNALIQIKDDVEKQTKILTKDNPKP